MKTIDTQTILPLLLYLLIHVFVNCVFILFFISSAIFSECWMTLPVNTQCCCQFLPLLPPVSDLSPSVQWWLQHLGHLRLALTPAATLPLACLALTGAGVAFFLVSFFFLDLAVFFVPLLLFCHTLVLALLSPAFTSRNRHPSLASTRLYRNNVSVLSGRGLTASSAGAASSSSLADASCSFSNTSCTYTHGWFTAKSDSMPKISSTL